MSYNHKEIEKNGKNTGQKRILSTPMMILKSQKFYALDMFPYPSGQGHKLNYTESEISFFR